MDIHFNEEDIFVASCFEPFGNHVGIELKTDKGDKITFTVERKIGTFFHNLVEEGREKRVRKNLAKELGF
jgi:hypothetical protein